MVPGLRRACTTCAAALAAQMTSARRPVAGWSLTPHTSVCPATAIRPSIWAPSELGRGAGRIGSGEATRRCGPGQDARQERAGRDRGRSLGAEAAAYIFTTSPASSLCSEWGGGRKFCTQLLTLMVVGSAGPRSLPSASSICGGLMVSGEGGRWHVCACVSVW